MLQLSSVNLPGGVQVSSMRNAPLPRTIETVFQRRKVESDALKMREFLAEGDVST